MSTNQWPIKFGLSVSTNRMGHILQYVAHVSMVDSIRIVVRSLAGFYAVSFGRRKGRKLNSLPIPSHVLLMNWLKKEGRARDFAQRAFALYTSNQWLIRSARSACICVCVGCHAHIRVVCTICHTYIIHIHNYDMDWNELLWSATFLGSNEHWAFRIDIYCICTYITHTHTHKTCIYGQILPYHMYVAASCRWPGRLLQLIRIRVQCRIYCVCECAAVQL